VDTLTARWPRLRDALPRVGLQVRETPVERWELEGASLLVKRDDLTTPTLGGNKARALELLLAGVGSRDVLLTVGSTGSTHALAVAHFGGQLGARTEVITWPQEEHDVSLATSARLRQIARVSAARSPATAMLRATARRPPTRSSCRSAAEGPRRGCSSDSRSRGWRRASSACVSCLAWSRTGGEC
jgi:hypothetical protein